MANQKPKKKKIRKIREPRKIEQEKDWEKQLVEVKRRMVKK